MLQCVMNELIIIILFKETNYLVSCIKAYIFLKIKVIGIICGYLRKSKSKERRFKHNRHIQFSYSTTATVLLRSKHISMNV